MKHGNTWRKYLKAQGWSLQEWAYGKPSAFCLLLAVQNSFLHFACQTTFLGNSISYSYFLSILYVSASAGKFCLTKFLKWCIMYYTCIINGTAVRLIICGYGGIGRRARLRIWCLRRAGSSPVTRTSFGLLIFSGKLGTLRTVWSVCSSVYWFYYC